VADLLVVEDDPDIAEVLELLLLSLGHQIRVARNGEEGLRLLDERLPDLVLLDVEMPVLSGPEMAYLMFVIDAGLEKVPILFLSGVMDLHLVAAKAGTPYYLGKPYHVNDLLSVLDRALIERSPPQPSAT
jgi:DNA-binding response OmpR family regulator